MADPDLTADEIACVNKMAELYERSETWVATGQPGQAFDPLELPPEKRGAILGVMDNLGLLTNVQHIMGRFDSFNITPQAIQVAREIRQAGLKMQLAEEDRKWRAEQERKDREYRDAQRREDMAYRDKKDREDAEWRGLQERHSNRQLWVAGVVTALIVAVILAGAQVYCTWWQISDARAGRATPPAAPSTEKP